MSKRTIHDAGGSSNHLRACLFDFGGTLDADGVTWQDRFYGLFGRYGFHLDREVFRQAFYQSDDRLAGMQKIREAGLDQTIRVLVDGLMGTLGLRRTVSRMDAIAEDFLAGMKQHVERNSRLLRSLKEHYELGIVSNFYGNLNKVCEELGIRSLFACILDSTQEGVMKPDPRIFRSALARLETKAAHTIFVGDNPSRDLIGAKAVGMPHVWLAGENREGAAPCCPDDPVIRSLEELCPLLLNAGDRPSGGKYR